MGTIVEKLEYIVEKLEIVPNDKKKDRNMVAHQSQSARRDQQ
jgi:hypothetical protein